MLFEVFDKFLNPKLLLLGEGFEEFVIHSGLGVHRVGDFRDTDQLEANAAEVMTSNKADHVSSKISPLTAFKLLMK